MMDYKLIIFDFDGTIAVTYGFDFKSNSDVEGYPHVAICSSPSNILDVLNCRN